MSKTADLILVTWNQLAYTRRCVESLLQHTAVPFRLLVVDNGSQADTIAYLDALQRDHPDRVLCLKQPENLGWVRGVNTGLRTATAPYVCLLNNDLILLPGWLERMLAVAESDPAIGLVNPTYNIKGESLDSFTRRIQSGEAEGRPSAYLEVGECNGACLLIRRRVLDTIGGLDEIYGTDGMDDSDFSRRARQQRDRIRLGRRRSG